MKRESRVWTQQPLRASSNLAYAAFALGLLPSASKQSYALRYGAPAGLGLLVGAFWGLSRIQTHLQRIAFDLPPSPLTNVYRNKLYVRGFH